MKNHDFFGTCCLMRFQAVVTGADKVAQDHVSRIREKPCQQQILSCHTPEDKDGQ